MVHILNNMFAKITMTISFFLFASVILCLFLLLVTTPANASTSCVVAIEKIWSGDGGYIWLHFTNGGSAYVGPTDPDREATVSLATTSLVTGKSFEVRYAATGISCSATGRSDLEGVYLVK